MNHLIKIHCTVVVNEMLPKGKADTIKWDVQQNELQFSMKNFNFRQSVTSVGNQSQLFFAYLNRG